MPRRTVNRVRVRVRKMARPKVVEAVPSAWAKEDFVLTRLKRAYENAQLALDAYVRRTGDPVALAPLTNSRDAARAALTQYLDTKKRKP